MTLTASISKIASKTYIVPESKLRTQQTEEGALKINLDLCHILNFTPTMNSRFYNMCITCIITCYI